MWRALSISADVNRALMFIAPLMADESGRHGACRSGREGIVADHGRACARLSQVGGRVGIANTGTSHRAPGAASRKKEKGRRTTPLSAARARRLAAPNPWPRDRHVGDF